jgi:hypothetical protein
MLLVTILLNDLQPHLRFGLEFFPLPQERAVLIHLGKPEGDMMALIVLGLDGGQSRKRDDHLLTPLASALRALAFGECCSGEV